MRIKLQTVLLMLSPAEAAFSGKVVTDPAPTGAKLLNKYKVELSGDDGRWQSVPTYAVKVYKTERVRPLYYNIKTSTQNRAVEFGL